MFKSLLRPDPKSQFDEPELSATQCDYYCAIFEFAQGSFPLTVWANSDEIGQRITTDRDLFRLSVVNTPTNIQTSIVDPRPIVIRSSFQGAHYIALYLQVLDVQARGFTRALVFVVANRVAELVDWLFSRRKSDLIGLGHRLQEHARAKFPAELRTYAIGLRAAIRHGPSDLESKFEELIKVMAAFDVVISEDDDDAFEDKPPDYYRTVTNDLRSASEMIQLNLTECEIRNFLNRLPTSTFQVNVLAKSAVGIGGSAYQTISVMTANYRDIPEPFLLSKSKYFHDCLFSLLAGQTLLIVTERGELGKSMADRFSVISPFKEPFSVACLENPRPLDCAKFSIVVCRPGTQVEGTGLAVLHIEPATFAGLNCPTDSALRDVAQYPTDIENTTVVSAVNNVKRIHARFQVKMAEARSRPLHTEEDMLKILTAWKFAPSDIPLCRFWTVCAAGSQAPRPVLLDWHMPRPPGLKHLIELAKVG